MTKKTEKSDHKIAARILQYFMVVFGAVFLVFVFGKSSFELIKTAPIFKVREVVSHQSLDFIRSRTLDRLIGQNIFDVDLQGLQRKLQLEYPQIDHLRLYRVYPNRIYVDAVRRDPFAVLSVKNSQVVVDKFGNVLALTSANAHLPMISGLTLDQPARVGQPVKHRDLNLAFEIITAVGSNARLQSMPVAELDLRNLSFIQCLLANRLKVILSEDDIQKKIHLLGIMTTQEGISPETVEYIDLRFKEPIIRKVEKAGVKAER